MKCSPSFRFYGIITCEVGSINYGSSLVVLLLGFMLKFPSGITMADDYAKIVWMSLKSIPFCLHSRSEYFYTPAVSDGKYTLYFLLLCWAYLFENLLLVEVQPPIFSGAKNQKMLLRLASETKERKETLLGLCFSD